MNGLCELIEMLFRFYRKGQIRLIYAEYNPQMNSIDVTTFESYILRIDCNKAENELNITPYSQNSLNALAIDEPLEYARLDFYEMMIEYLSLI